MSASHELTSRYRTTLDALANLGECANKTRGVKELTQGDFDAVCADVGLNLTIIRLARKQAEHRKAAAFFGETLVDAPADPDPS